MNCRNKTAVIVAVTAILAGWGCSNGTPSVSGSSTEASVKGTVTAKGKPITSGQILFNPANINRRDAKTRSAPIQKDGSYSITTLIGENMVTVESPGLPMNRTPIDVQSGENNIPIDVEILR